MDLIDQLLSGPPMREGRGVNHEGQAFVGRMKIEPLVGRRAALLSYTATGLDGAHHHAEATLVGPDATGRPCLWPVMEELPVVLPHAATASHPVGQGWRFTFATGPSSDRASFREEITIEIQPDGILVYAHAWGMPEGDFGDRSTCTLAPVP